VTCNVPLVLLFVPVFTAGTSTIADQAKLVPILRKKAAIPDLIRLFIGIVVACSKSLTVQFVHPCPRAREFSSDQPR